MSAAESMSAQRRAHVLAALRARRAVRCKRAWRLTQARIGAAIAIRCIFVV